MKIERNIMMEYIKTFALSIVVYGIIMHLFGIIGLFHHNDIKETLRDEFCLIPTISDVFEVEQEESDNTEVIRKSVTFRTSLSHSIVIDYYDAKLRENGWHLFKEEKLYGWGEDLGGSLVVYKKNDLVAILQYAGEKANYGWDYDFSMGWGDRRFK